ncbi:hypothetical protein HPB50_023812 [Hyalomma asiaticum]|uniref:Uncharacterized protein n=1 Tax=Hyalomma asiaticum TaxID=266040 RepID=A0ACB7SQF8_HYAAI|nr:hypothetical protein HPB50_023812 [Hyalomma asiaticum]
MVGDEEEARSATKPSSEDSNANINRVRYARVTIASSRSFPRTPEDHSSNLTETPGDTIYTYHHITTYYRKGRQELPPTPESAMRHLPNAQGRPIPLLVELPQADGSRTHSPPFPFGGKLLFGPLARMTSSGW